MTLKRRLGRSNVIMFLIPLLMATALLTLGAGIAFYILETKYLPQIGLSLNELHIKLEQYEPMLTNFEIFVLVYWLNVVAWLYKSAVNERINRSLWPIPGVFFNIFAVAAFCIVRDQPERS